MTSMFRLAAAIAFAPVVFAQTAQESEIAIAAKSPMTLARYVEFHKTVDWKSLGSALGLKESEYWFAPCGGNAPANDAPCSAEIATVANPDQAIVIIRGSGFSFTVEYIRFLQDPKGGWQFAGENSANKRNGPSNHEVIRVGGKPFLKISSNHTQNGFGIQQEVEDWFDLTKSDFEPVFSFTPDGSVSGIGFGVGRTIEARCFLSEASGLERIGMTLQIRFDGMLFPGIDATYEGVYYRAANEKKFTLASAQAGLFGGTTMPAKDFEDLADPFGNPSREKYLVWALPGFQRIATGSDAETQKWLRAFLDTVSDTPEKRTLLDLLTNPSAPAPPPPPTPR
jgi:hypothetical protein